MSTNRLCGIRRGAERVCRRKRRKARGMEDEMVRLSEAEWKVMDVLWEEAPRTIMQLTRCFQETTGWTKHTIMTFLKRMEEKGAVFYEAGERAKLYYPKIDRQEAALQETEEFLEKVFDGRMGLMLNTMVERKALSGEEIAELYEILRRAEADRLAAGREEAAENGKDGGKK
ncbi:MAG: BlaI/MecI/CopY family transcriptional regulator [Bacteroidales bacterium]|nr:BlaI/MecI/CopY family transcriptional regulator [Bacteroidales bacterium]